MRPYAVPGPEGTTVQVPGPRNAFRFPAYFRIDLGFAKRLTFSRATEADQPIQVQLSADVLNLYDSVGAVRYEWAPNAEGLWQRIPTRLTPRLFNLRARVDF
jgi:hypothetical protein